MVRLTPPERSLLLTAYGSGVPFVSVLRSPAPPHARLVAGSRTLEGKTRLRALASLYSRGLITQTRLNRFSLTPRGKELVRDLRRFGDRLLEPERRAGSGA